MGDKLRFTCGAVGIVLGGLMVTPNATRADDLTVDADPTCVTTTTTVAPGTTSTSTSTSSTVAETTTR